MFKAAQTFRSTLNIELDARKCAVASDIMHTSSKMIEDASIAHKASKIHHRKKTAWLPRVNTQNGTLDDDTESVFSLHKDTVTKIQVADKLALTRL